jgi:hypothetical protein
VEFGGMALGRYASFKPECRVHHPFRYAKAMVIKFMALAFFLEALIILYTPAEWIVGIMGRENAWAIITAALLGVPTYTSNLSALPTY